jgi:hypothetical protein
MEGFLGLVLIVAVLALLGTTATLFGVDTRPGFDDRRTDRRTDLAF